MIADEFDMVDRARHVQGIHDQPVFGVALAGEALADQLPHRRAGAVGTDQVARLHRHPAAVGTGERGLDPLAGLVDAGQLGAQQRLYPGMMGQAGAQGEFQIGLEKGHQLGMAVDRAQGIETAEFAKGRRAQPHLGNGDGLEGALAQAGKLEDAQGLVVEGDRPRRLEDLGGLVDHQGTHAMAPQEVGNGGAHRPEADDQDIGDHADRPFHARHLSQTSARAVSLVTIKSKLMILSNMIFVYNPAIDRTES
nr:hypothetical protein [Oleomonas cavernae]